MMRAVDRQGVAGADGERDRVGTSQSVQRGIIECGLEFDQLSGHYRLPQRAAIAEVELAA